MLAGITVVNRRVGSRLAGAVVIFGPLAAVGGVVALLASPFVGNGLRPVGCLLAAAIGGAVSIGLARLGDRLLDEERGAPPDR